MNRRKTKDWLAILGNHAAFKEQHLVQMCLAILARGLILIESFDSGLRPLRAKPPANQHVFHFRASALPPPQNIQYFDRIRAIDNADANTTSAGPYFAAPREADRVGQANPATEQVGLLSTERQTGGVGELTSPNPKTPINRVRKPENRQVRSPKIAVACENCR